MRRRRLREAQADPQAQAAPELIDWRLRVWVRVCDVRVEDGGPRWDSGALLTAQGSQKRQAPSGVQPGSAVNHKSSPPPNVAPSHFKLALLLPASLTCPAHITHLSTIQTAVKTVQAYQGIAASTKRPACPPLLRCTFRSPLPPPLPQPPTRTRSAENPRQAPKHTVLQAQEVALQKCPRARDTATRHGLRYAARPRKGRRESNVRRSRTLACPHC